MLKVFYDEYCLRLELCIRYLIARNFTFQCIHMKDSLRSETGISDGPIIFLDKELIGTFENLKFAIEKNPPTH